MWRNGTSSAKTPSYLASSRNDFRLLCGNYLSWLEQFQPLCLQLPGLTADVIIPTLDHEDRLEVLAIRGMMTGLEYELAKPSDAEKRTLGSESMQVSSSENEPIVFRAQISVPIRLLKPGFSPRLAGEDNDHIKILAESDSPVPPILVHHASMRVFDGMHRLRAAALRGEEAIMVEYSDGTDEAAFVLAVKRNAEHGRPLTRSDRAVAVRRIHESHPTWSDRAIASATGISARIVASDRRSSSDDNPQSYVRLSLDGRQRPLDAVAGRLRASEHIVREPSASLREIANSAQISLSTAQDVRERMRLGMDPVPPKCRSPRTADNKAKSSAGDSEPASLPRIAPADRDALIQKLRRDPSLRFNETGRLLIRLLDLQSDLPEKLKKLADHVPAHWLGTVTVLAGTNANAWQHFVAQLNDRLRTSA
ncbi:ParB/RepB/Spo0J family partition protein [Nocardia brasiliensis]|uniref:ParB/RepB/Spo0J family partition protein n=1 Tax=Nocardia brasiliensis TaxID=37326 RepID=UPI00366D9F4C